MAAPTLTLLNHTLIEDAEATTGWTKFDTLDSDFAVENANAITGTFRTDGTVGYYDNGTAPVTAVGKTLRYWLNTTNLAYMDTEANGGYEVLCYDGTTTQYITMFGSDTYKGGWFRLVIDMAQFTSLTLANVQRWGLRIQHTASAKNIDNVWIDGLRYLDGYSMTGGTSGDKVTPLDIVTRDETDGASLTNYGVLVENEGIYFCSGTIQFGTGATTHFFEMDGEVLIFIDNPVAAGLYKLAGVGSGSTIDIINSVLRSTGTTDATRFDFDFDDAGLTGSNVTITDNLIVRADQCLFKSGSTITGNTFDDCGQITHGGADLSDCTVKNYEGTAGTAAILYNVAADPDGETDDMTFVKGTAATHAIELGTNTPSEITLRNWNVSGYNAADEQNDSVIYNNSAKAITVNVIGGTGTFSVRNGASASTTIVTNPVTTAITVKDADTQAAISGAYVYLEASDGTGPLPYQDASTGWSRTTTTATVTLTAHGFSTGQRALIEPNTGTADDSAYGVKTVTVTGANTFTYTMLDAGATTGITVDVTGVLIAETTTAGGLADDTRSLSVNQPVTGWVRKHTTSPYYKEAPIAATINKDSGYSATILLISDE